MKQKTMWIGLHDEPHPDEFLALLQALLEGETTFPGVNHAWNQGRVKFFPSGREVNLQKLPCRRSHILEFGYGGRKYDEHGKEKAGSAATLLAKDLGLLDHPAWKPLLDWVLANDQDATGTAFDWADVMKVFFHAGWSNMSVLKRTIRVMRAVYHYNAGHHRRRGLANLPDFWELSAQFVLSLTDNPYKNNDKYAPTGPEQAAAMADIKNSPYRETITWLLKYEADIKGLSGFSPTPRPPREPGFMEMPKIVTALYCNGASVEEVRQLVFDVLQSRITEQNLFFAAVDEYASITRDATLGKHNPKGYIIKVVESGMIYRVAVVISDNRRIMSAIRATSRPPQVIVRALTDGHKSFFMKPLNSEPIIVRLRAACWEAMGHREPLTPEELRAEWTLPKVPSICWQKRGSNGLNWSLTNKEMGKIPLNMRQYLECIVSGLREVMQSVKAHHRQNRRNQRSRMRASQAASAALVSAPSVE